MRGKMIEVSGVVLGMLGLVLGVSLAEETKPAPEKAQVEVTYYYLPG